MHSFTEEVLDQAELNLAPCRVGLWAGCAFINFDDKALSRRCFRYRELPDKKIIENSRRDNGLSQLMQRFLVFSEQAVCSERRRDGKKNDEKILRDKKVTHLMPTLFPVVQLSFCKSSQLISLG